MVLEDSFIHMKIKKQLQLLLKNKIDNSLLNKIPSGYSRIGDIAIFHQIERDLYNYRKLIGDAIIDLDPQINVVIEQVGTRTSFRIPKIKHLAGEERYTTIHNEYRTSFEIDVSKITFSPGNKGERNHLINLVDNNEVICDMFACIGNLSLPIVVNNPSVQVYGIEWNEVAFSLLEKNIRLNKIEDRYFPIYGDNREKTPSNIASRILMGYFEIDEKHFNCALKAIKTKGWIHYHSTTTRDNLNEPEEFIYQLVEDTNYNLVIKEIRKIKKISPRLYHLCTDIYVEK